MKRTYRRRSSHETAIQLKENSPEQMFFGARQSQSFFQPASAVQRKCEKCEDEDKKVQKKEAGAITGPVSSSKYISNLDGRGKPLSKSDHAFFSSKMNYDFNGVKIHTGTDAADSAKGIHAKAYTVGNNIVFNDGNYNTTSYEGKKLMAHELAHVIQQNKGGAKETISRTPATPGFDIRDVFPQAASFPSTIFFEMGQSTVPSSELGKIPAIASPPSRDITLVGTASEEGNDLVNTHVINQRLRAVNSKLSLAGHTGPRTLTPQLSAGSGNIDYRRVRAVDVIPTPTVVPPGGAMPSATPPCTATAANPTPELEPCGSSFSGSHPDAQNWTSNAHSLLSSGDAVAISQATVLFPGIPVPTLVSHLGNLLTQITNLPAHFRCHNTCDSGCSRPAYNTGSGSSQMMTLCPDFINSSNATNQSETLIHESLHATTGLTTADVAYSTTRLISSLTGPQALNNTDSFVLLILRINGVVPPAGVAATDTYDTTITGVNLDLARNALAYLEQWLLNAEFDTSLLYNAINSNIGSSSGWADAFEAEIAGLIAPVVGITDPGPNPFATAPVEADKVKIAGMFDRFTTLRQNVYVTGITINRAAAGVRDSWDFSAKTFTLGAPFFSLSPVNAVRHLMRLMIIAMGTVPSGLVNKYVESADRIRAHRSTLP
ncbi:MAG: hypothetical protein ABS67_03220 [Niabella sp. SCN 42-15]|nr:MAG: hypothetical protein ABS67_03220 [Niabella sp. SCN 42-15]